jgi:hypothetical protein
MVSAFKKVKEDWLNPSTSAGVRCGMKDAKIYIKYNPVNENIAEYTLYFQTSIFVIEVKYEDARKPTTPKMNRNELTKIKP